jgi:hypothetical protein
MRVFIHIQGVYKRMVRFQKLTRNLFLILHGQNVHRQQRQHVRCNGLQCVRYPIMKFLEGRGQWWYVNAVFNEPPKKEITWY